MESDNPACTGFFPDPCISYTNCTGSGFVENWTESCCQPQAIRDTRLLYLIVIGCVGIVGTVCNVITVFTFIYLYCFGNRIKRNFNQNFAGITEDPVFFLILHLSICDLFYCIIGLPSHWIVYYNGYFPYYDWMCSYSAFFRHFIGNLPFYRIVSIF